MNAMKCVQLDFKLYRLHHSTDTLECLQGTMDVYATIKLHPATSDPFQTDIMLKLEPLAHGSPANRHTIWGECLLTSAQTTIQTLARVQAHVTSLL